MIRAPASILLDIVFALAAVFLSSGTRAEMAEFEACFEFDPPLISSSDGEAAFFASCFKDSYNTDNISRGFLVESVELDFEDDDVDEDSEHRYLRSRKKSKKMKAKGKNKNRKCNGNGCSSEAENIHNQSCPGCLRKLQSEETFVSNLRGAPSRFVRRVLGGDTAAAKSHTELLLDDCVLSVNSQEGLLDGLVGGVTLLPCNS